MGLACFDFDGCGNRYDSEFITLGHKECKDVDVAAKYLKSQGFRVAGWGRSMGGVSLLKSTEIEVMICDSAFSNLSELCKESSEKEVPSFLCCCFHLLYPCLFSCIKCKVKEKAGLDVEDLDIAAHLKKESRRENYNKKICFIHGENDKMVPP